MKAIFLWEIKRVLNPTDLLFRSCLQRLAKKKKNKQIKKKNVQNINFSVIKKKKQLEAKPDLRFLFLGALQEAVVSYLVSLDTNFCFTPKAIQKQGVKLAVRGKMS